MHSIENKLILKIHPGCAPLNAHDARGIRCPVPVEHFRNLANLPEALKIAYEENELSLEYDLSQMNRFVLPLLPP